MIGTPSFSGQSARALLPLIILSWIKLDGDLYPPGLRQTTHQLTWPACQKSLLTPTLRCQHRLIRMQEGDTPINAGECRMGRHISERGKKAQFFLAGSRGGESTELSFSGCFPPLSVCGLLGQHEWWFTTWSSCHPHPLSLFHHWSGSGKASHTIPEPNPAGTAVVSWCSHPK